MARDSEDWKTFRTFQMQKVKTEYWARRELGME
jgi:hypothetical protein